MSGKRGVTLMTLCSSKSTCKGYGRLPGYNLPAPGDEYEYSQTKICILCRFDSELCDFEGLLILDQFVHGHKISLGLILLFVMDVSNECLKTST